MRAPGGDLHEEGGLPQGLHGEREGHTVPPAAQPRRGVLLCEYRQKGGGLPQTASGLR